MLAVPVLAGSAAYAVAESFDWQSGLDMKVHEALEFYGIIGVATVGGVALNFTHLDPMRALVWSAEINGIIAVPIMAVMMLLASREDIMGEFVIRPRLRRLGWARDGRDGGDRGGDVQSRREAPRLGKLGTNERTVFAQTAPRERPTEKLNTKAAGIIGLAVMCSRLLGVAARADFCRPVRRRRRDGRLYRCISHS